MKITVITPIHGKQKQYGKMIQEIGYKLNEQTIKPFEWIIVCDEKSKWINDLDIPLFGKILVAERNNISIKRNLALEILKKEPPNLKSNTNSIKKESLKTQT